MKELTCILCPKGCHITIEKDHEEYIINGHSCKRGLAYAKQEYENPLRGLQTTVQTIFPEYPRVSVKLDKAVPIEQLDDIMNICHQILIDKNLTTGEIIVENICGTGANLVATTDLVLRLKEVN